MKITFQKIGPDAVLPTRDAESVGYKICISENILVPVGDCVNAHTQLAVDTLPYGICGLIIPDSKLAQRTGVRLADCVQVLESNKEIVITLFGDNGAFELNKGECVAKLIILPFFTPECEFKI